MNKYWFLVGLLLLTAALPLTSDAAGLGVQDIEVADVNNDAGTSLGVLWRWDGEPVEGDTFTIELELTDEVLAEYELTADEQARMDTALADLAAAMEEILKPLKEAEDKVGERDAELQLAINTRADNVAQLRSEYWAAENERKEWQHKFDKARDKFLSKTGELEPQLQTYDFLTATRAVSPWVVTNIANQAAMGVGTKGDAKRRFGQFASEPEKLYIEVGSFTISNPTSIAGTYSSELNQFGIAPPETTSVELVPGVEYNLRMLVSEDPTPIVLGAATPGTNHFNGAKTNNLIVAVLFAAVILSAIMIARRNPNLFIRRIQGLEAVDEAIGRATEMGKPVLYLCGLDSLATLSTLAAVNILGRVARRVADYDSDLIVPCRDPVVLTVAQEVAKEAYIDRGRPDAFREDKIFFVTDDQFSYTATTCAIMMREKPAANFFMGYYYAESLLLAETGASTGAIQIAGTDATHQLPFFITTCDYTLIGEELYAASAYMSREPMLLGSLKGQDLGKAVMMLFIIVQTILFLFSPELGFLKILVEPL